MRQSSVRRVHVFYRGHVQGVGFRYTTRETAFALGLNCWVRNLPDGSVEVVCEGNEKELKDFLETMDNGFLSRYINDKEITWESTGQRLNGFEIKF